MTAHQLSLAGQHWQGKGGRGGDNKGRLVHAGTRSPLAHCWCGAHSSSKKRVCGCGRDESVLLDRGGVDWGCWLAGWQAGVGCRAAGRENGGGDSMMRCVHFGGRGCLAQLLWMVVGVLGLWNGEGQGQGRVEGWEGNGSSQ